MMSKQIFYYGAMSSSKSAQLLMQNYNYKEQGSITKLIKPAIDTRDGNGIISSRIGMKEYADFVILPDDTGDDIYELLEDDNFGLVKTNVLLIDEAQFLNDEQINAIVEWSSDNRTELHAFGLLKDFQNKLFPGSKRWLETSDSIVEIKTTCSKCTRKATCNLRLLNGKPVYEGDTIQIGGNESYVSVCSRHYYEYDE